MEKKHLALSPTEISPRQFGALLEWTDSAKLINSTADPQLSSAWAAALVNVFDHNYALLDALEDLDEETYIAFVSGESSLTNAQIDILEKAGLVASATLPKEGGTKFIHIAILLSCWIVVASNFLQGTFDTYFPGDLGKDSWWYDEEHPGKDKSDLFLAFFVFGVGFFIFGDVFGFLRQHFRKASVTPKGAYMLELLEAKNPKTFVGEEEKVSWATRLEFFRG